MPNKYREEIPETNAAGEVKMEKVPFDIKAEQEVSYYNRSAQRVLDEWNHGIIICRRWAFRSDDDIEMV